MSYNSKYTGEQVEGFLDQIANGEISGGSSVYKWNWNSEMNGTFTEEEFENLSNADVVYITTGVADMEMLYSVDGRAVVEDALHLGAHILSFETDTDNSKAAYVESITFIFDNASKTWNAQGGDAELITNEQLTSALEDKQDKVSGKQLSTEDFTTALKTKLEGLSNYDDTELSEALSTLRGDFDKLVSGDTTTAIKTFNEVIAFLDGIQDSQDLSSIIASIEQQIAGKMDKVTLATVATSGSYNDLSNKPTIPTAVTESTVSGWGFTKNTGTYSKPSTGIPKSDLASAVQTSLGKADTALQSYTEQYKGTVTGVKINGTTKNPSSGVVDLGTVVTSHQDISGKQDKLVSGTNIKTINGQSILGGGNITIEGGSGGNYVEKERLGETEVAYIQGFDTGNMVYGLPDAVANGDADDYLVSVSNLKTINGESILGSGDIEVSGGGSSGGSGAYAEVNHGTSDTTFTLTPNTFHVWDEVSALTLTLGSETAGVANEYLFQFTSGATATTLTLPDDIKWTEELVIEANRIYQISILKGLASVLSWENTPGVTLITFYYNSTPYQAEEGMTWSEFIDSRYNTGGFYTEYGSVFTDYYNMVYHNYNAIAPTTQIVANAFYDNNSGGGGGN